MLFISAAITIERLAPRPDIVARDRHRRHLRQRDRGVRLRSRLSDSFPLAGERTAGPCVQSFSMNFSGYRVDTVHRVVTTPRGRIVRLEPKAFDLLLYFTQHPEETISRERLIADVWDGKFVTDDAVMVAVYALRQAFEDDARTPDRKSVV